MCGLRFVARYFEAPSVATHSAGIDEHGITIDGASFNHGE